MDSPNTQQSISTGKRLSASKKLLAAALPFAALFINGCTSDSLWGDRQRDQPIYGVFQGATADYSRGGAAGRIVDNGFSVDGDDRVVAPEQHKGSPPPADALTDSSKDTLAGKHSDALGGKDKDTLEDADQSTKDTEDPLDGGGDGNNDSLDPDSKAKQMAVPGQNFYSYEVMGHVVNATVQIKINDADVPVGTGELNTEVSDQVKPGMNRVDITYTPNDATSSALISIRKGGTNLPDCVRFDSNVYVLNQAPPDSSDVQTNTPAAITKSFYFLAD